MTIGEALKKIRTQKGISSKTLSKKIRLHKTYIGKVEANEIIPTPDKLKLICQHLELPEELTVLLLLDKKYMHESKREIFSTLLPIFVDLLVDYATNIIPKPLEEEKELALIMKGGGIKGIAYVGALEELSKHYQFTWFAGTSAGAITASLLACGYEVEELKTILFSKNFNDFRDSNFLKSFVYLFIYKGLYKAESFTNWMSRLLAEKLELPSEVLFLNLPKRATIYASKRNSLGICFDSTHEKCKDVSVSFATRCSMSIPIIFTPQQDQGMNIFDGGIQNNYPVDILLDENPDANFIGLYLGSPIFDRAAVKTGILRDLFSIWSESKDLISLREYQDKTIVIDTSPISTLNFKLSDLEKELLLESGKLAAIKFLKKNGKSNISNEELKKIDAMVANKRATVISKRRKKRFIRMVTAIFLGITLIYMFA